MEDLGVIQVVMTPTQRQAFEEWLASRGSHLFLIPSERDTDLSTYGIRHY